MTEFELNEAIEIKDQLKKLNTLNNNLSEDKIEIVGLVIRDKNFVGNFQDKSVLFENYKKIELAPESIKSIVLNVVRNRIMLLKSKFEKL